MCLTDIQSNPLLIGFCSFCQSLLIPERLWTAPLSLMHLSLTSSQALTSLTARAMKLCQACLPGQAACAQGWKGTSARPCPDWCLRTAATALGASTEGQLQRCLQGSGRCMRLLFAVHSAPIETIVSMTILTQPRTCRQLFDKSSPVAGKNFPDMPFSKLGTPVRASAHADC